MIEKIRRFGILTKGLAYFLAGVLTLLTAVNLGGKVSGKNEVIAFLEDQIFGQVLIVLFALGLLGYTAWRMYSAFLDGKNEGSDKTGYAKRTGYFFSGLIYGALGISTLLSVIGSSNSSGNTKESLVSSILAQTYGQYLLYVVAIILLGVGIYQFYKVYNKKFLQDVADHGEIESQEVLEKAGLFGFITRGISFIIFAYFVFRAALQHNADQVRGLEGVFKFLHDLSFGNILMGLMALGFIAYGVFQYFLARYSRIYS